MGNSNNNEANQQVNRMQAATNNADRNRWRKMGGRHHNFAALIALIIICGIWTVAAHAVAKPFIFPYFEDVIKEVVYSLSDAPCTDWGVLCIHHRTSAWNDHGILA